MEYDWVLRDIANDYKLVLEITQYENKLLKEEIIELKKQLEKNS